VLRLNTHEVSQLDGLPVYLAGQYFTDAPRVRMFVHGFQGSMLFWPDEIEDDERDASLPGSTPGSPMQ
jgi:hypothetical protein